MNPTTAVIIAGALVLVVVVLVVWSAVEAVLWLEDHTKRIRALEDILDNEILERALEEVALEHGLDVVDELALDAVRRRSLAGRLDALEESVLEEANETTALEHALNQIIDELEDSVRRLAALEHTLEAATITFHYHAPWSPLYDQDAPGVWADLTTAAEEV